MHQIFSFLPLHALSFWDEVARALPEQPSRLFDRGSLVALAPLNQQRVIGTLNARAISVLNKRVCPTTIGTSYTTSSATTPDPELPWFRIPSRTMRQSSLWLPLAETKCSAAQACAQSSPVAGRCAVRTVHLSAAVFSGISG
ncbi:hypothetical protein BKA67DRAFT_656735 [Truncatella angustata]|uniref:Uncharacterized protein n=1 Tax=Truncatella angustata TaxID=152316 RepID=A0A9P9A0M0_9PEZI|nr:uncharacterized protein BKA67DRAFT_656735 [Truncatella angustata]KAH6658547.1 hypothetical protein BKA67DRAFT_656735 [Truncatella angustata]